MTVPSRAQMQNEALIIESLLNSAMAMLSGDTPLDALIVVELAHDRAAAMNKALDSLNAQGWPDPGKNCPKRKALDETQRHFDPS